MGPRHQNETSSGRTRSSARARNRDLTSSLTSPLEIRNPKSTIRNGSSELLTRLGRREQAGHVDRNLGEELLLEAVGAHLRRRKNLATSRVVGLVVVRREDLAGIL